MIKNIAEGWAKKTYVKVMRKHFVDAFGSCQEIHVHLCFARDLEFFDKNFVETKLEQYKILSRRLIALTNKFT